MIQEDNGAASSSSTCCSSRRNEALTFTRIPHWGVFVCVCVRECILREYVLEGE